MKNEFIVKPFSKPLNFLISGDKPTLIILINQLQPYLQSYYWPNSSINLSNLIFARNFLGPYSRTLAFPDRSVFTQTRSLNTKLGNSSSVLLRQFAQRRTLRNRTFLRNNISSEHDRYSNKYFSHSSHVWKTSFLNLTNSIPVIGLALGKPKSQITPYIQHKRPKTFFNELRSKILIRHSRVFRPNSISTFFTAKLNLFKQFLRLYKYSDFSNYPLFTRLSTKRKPNFFLRNSIEKSLNPYFFLGLKRAPLQLNPTLSSVLWSRFNYVSKTSKIRRKAKTYLRRKFSNVALFSRIKSFPQYPNRFKNTQPFKNFWVNGFYTFFFWKRMFQHENIMRIHSKYGNLILRRSPKISYYSNLRTLLKDSKFYRHQSTVNSVPILFNRPKFPNKVSTIQLNPKNKLTDKRTNVSWVLSNGRLHLLSVEKALYRYYVKRKMVIENHVGKLRAYLDSSRCTPFTLNQSVDKLFIKQKPNNFSKYRVYNLVSPKALTNTQLKPFRLLNKGLRVIKQGKRSKILIWHLSQLPIPRVRVAQHFYKKTFKKFLRNSKQPTNRLCFFHKRMLKIIDDIDYFENDSYNIVEPRPYPLGVTKFLNFRNFVNNEFTSTSKFFRNTIVPRLLIFYPYKNSLHEFLFSGFSNSNCFQVKPLYSFRFVSSPFSFLNYIINERYWTTDLMRLGLSQNHYFNYLLFPDTDAIKAAIFRKLNNQKLLFQSRTRIHELYSKTSENPNIQMKSSNACNILSMGSRQDNLNTLQKKNSMQFSHFFFWKKFLRKLNISTNYRSPAPHIRRIRFKPGYGRIWRIARKSIRELLDIPVRYQYRLTPKIQQKYFNMREGALAMKSLTIEFALMATHLLTDNWTSKLFFNSGNIFLNGINCTNRATRLFLNDFIQLLVNIKFYLVLRLINSWTSQKNFRVSKLFYRKIQPMNNIRIDKTPKLSRNLPYWFFDLQHFYTDIPKYLEVDYFTLSIYVVHDYLYYERFTPFRNFRYNPLTLNMYNWKYIT